jgi:cytochrome c oxidase assembly protein subunit 11
MPVVFFVDPEMDKDPNLKREGNHAVLYLFPVEEPVKPLAARAGKARRERRL